MWYYVLSRIWRNLHINIDIEIDRNRISEKLLKLGGECQKSFIFKGGAGLGGGVTKFVLFRGACDMTRGLIF